IRSGLAYLDLKCPTQKEYEEIPHIEMTADQPWDPSILDLENTPEAVAGDYPPEKVAPTPLAYISEDEEEEASEDIIAMNYTMDPHIEDPKDELLDKIFNNELLQAYNTAIKVHQGRYLPIEDEFIPLPVYMDPPDNPKGSKLIYQPNSILGLNYGQLMSPELDGRPSWPPPILD
ncbi:MAG: hypothetical protein V2J89_17490, partial [Halieaceae bacterium]|nr:hypothetical protein [Halieaceae bacterium]